MQLTFDAMQAAENLIPKLTDASIDRQSLENWYDAEAKKISGRIEYLYSALNQLLWFPIVIIYIVFFVHFRDLRVSEALLGSAIWTAFFGVIPLTGCGIIFYHKNRIPKKISRLISNTRDISPESHPELRLICDAIIKRMGIEDCQYQMRFYRNDSYYPMIIEQGRNAYLLIPRNFFKILYDSVEQADAILTHEFSHIVQKDTLNYAVSKPISRSFLIFGGIIGVVGIAYAVTSHNFFLFLCGAWAVQLYKMTQELVNRSEILADSAVLLFSNPEALIASFAYSSDDDFHPPRSKRIANILELALKFKKEK